MIAYPPPAPLAISSPESTLSSISSSSSSSMRIISPRRMTSCYRSAKHLSPSMRRKRLAEKEHPYTSTTGIHTSKQEYPLHVLAQKLSNKGASHLKQGNYERAIPYLAKALRLAEEWSKDQEQQQQQQQQRDNDEQQQRRQQQQPPPSEACTCAHCQLEMCLLLSGNSNIPPPPPPSRWMGQDDADDDDSPPSPSMRKSQLTTSRTASSTTATNTTTSVPRNMPFTLSSIPTSQDYTDGMDEEQPHHQDEEEDLSAAGFLYQQPLIVSSTCIREQHDMGVTLSLVILFNLAIAYHLVGGLDKARQLYELCYQLQVDHDQEEQEQQQQQAEQNDHADADTSSSSPSSSSSTSLWFTMVVTNNLSEIHKRQGHEENYQLCLQHLLSTTMYMVDSCRQQQHLQQLQQQQQQQHRTTPTRATTSRMVDSSSFRSTRSVESSSLSLYYSSTASSSSPTSSPTSSSSSSSSDLQQQLECHDYMKKTVLDGFFRNISKIILGKQAAARAA